jgi:hypothetical protein
MAEDLCETSAEADDMPLNSFFDLQDGSDAISKFLYLFVYLFLVYLSDLSAAQFCVPWIHSI